ncbi:hypothetical protein Ahy_A05g024209 [Arachis hypogaea]|uniref:Uncharacterized protein n=1 Tax=Arachis hypogaea TaxID=3818 RepID=A0A445D5C4_ARAHY|nr:hypothetical protein Ahy_A05g024209 [Arachis hypogaea]
MFIATRTSRKRKEVDEEIQTAVEDFQHHQAAGEIEEEAFEALFGKEQSGRVRLYGRSVTKTDLKKYAEINEIKNQHKEKLSSLKDKLGHMEAQQQKTRGQTVKTRQRDSWVTKYDQVIIATIGTWNEARRTRSFITIRPTVSY